MGCERCGTINEPTAQFCSNCGTHLTPPTDTTPTAAPPTAAMPVTAAPAAAPPPPSSPSSAPAPDSSNTTFVAAAIAAVVVVIGGIVALTVFSGSDDDAGAPAASTIDTAAGTTTPDSAPTDTTVPETTTATPTTTVPDPTTTGAPTTTVPADPNEAARQQLTALIDGDRPTVDGLVGSWVPQISAKSDGVEWEGVTYDHVAILNEHNGLRDLYGAVLADGAEYNFTRDGEPMAGWYFSLVPEPSADAQGALDWCVAENIDRDNCAAKLVSNDRTIAPNLQLQP